MREKWNYILYLVWFAYLILSAVIMFGNGFLLSRKTLSDVSECEPLNKFDCDGRFKGNSSVKEICNDEEKIRRILATPGAPLACAPSRSRVMFVLVDALRYDFTEYDERIEKPLPYQNRLPIIKETMDRYPERTRLFRFMADPPTTTLQRVKALVTGSLPTFIDAGSNFAAMQLQEDNIIEQITKSGGKAVLLGDDTWARLMPKKWLRSHAMYSFHTWDLDTVDREVDSKIFDEVKKDDWDLLLAHYLGVDHAGHRYGPNHPEMTRKLKETNDRLKRFIEDLPPDVLLYVVGDHGMTETGDHGGESKAERTAAFFVYRGLGLSSGVVDLSTGSEVQQTDFAPTMSAAFGRPPPAPSLGNILLTALPKTSVTETLLHITNNLKQMTQYLVRYGEESQQISLDRLANLINATREQLDKATGVETSEELNKYVNDVRILGENIRTVFREVWVEFDSLSMLRALLLLFLAIFFNWLVTEGLPVERIPHIFASSFVTSGLISQAIGVGVCFAGYYFKLFEDIGHAIILVTGLISGVIVCALIIMHWDGITQRWYDGRAQFYERFARSALVASGVVLLSNSYIIEEGAGLSFLTISILGLMAWNIGNIKVLGLWGLFGLVMAATRTYRGCREEQGDCWTAGEGIPTGQASRAALVLALGSMAGVVAVARRHVGWRGHGIVVAGLFACSHWAVGWGSLGSPSRSRLLARGAWLVLATMFVLLFRKEASGPNLPLIVLSLLLYIANSLALGAAYAPAAGLVLLAGFLTLIIVSFLKNDTNKFSLASRSNSSVACVWALLASYGFYASGHHATLGHVRWAPAFHAGDPNYFPSAAPPITAVLISLELFGIPLLFGCAVPLLVLWPRAGSASPPPRAQATAIFSVTLKFMLCFAIRVFACALSATVHCRHLMIWGVFTPKLMFESGACLCAVVGATVGATLAVRQLPERAPAERPPDHARSS